MKRDYNKEMVRIENTNYTVSEDGLIINSITGKVRKIQTDKDGYCRIQLTAIDGKVMSCYIHRLVAKAYCRKTDDRNDVNHIDGNKSNNHFENLEWCTPSQNQAHAVKIGLKKSGVKCWNSKFSLQDIENIKKLHASGIKKIRIAEVYKVERCTIGNIISGKRYKQY